MKITRPSLETDQENTEKAYELIEKLLSNHPEIEPTLWAGAVWGILVNGYIQCGFTYSEFVEEMNRAVKHFENWFDK